MIPRYAHLARAFAQQADVKGRVMRQEDRAFTELVEPLASFAHLGRTLNHGIGDLMDVRGRRRDVALGIDQRVEEFPFHALAIENPRGGDLTDLVATIRH